MSWSHHQVRALASIFQALDEAGINWIVLRNWEGLPETNRSKDVDIGLDKSNFARGQKVIEKSARQEGFDRVHVENFQYVRCITLIGLFYDGLSSIKIDLLDGFVFRGAQVFDFGQLSANSISASRLRVPNKTDDAVMLWMKPLLTGGIVREKYVGDIAKAASGDGEGFRVALERTLGMKWGGRAWKAISDGKLEDTIPMKAALRRAAWRTAFQRKPFKTLRNAGYHFFAEVERRSRRNPATFLAVAGPDGVGKTTFISLLVKRLADLQVKDHTDLKVRHFRPHVLPNLKTLVTGTTERSEDFQRPHRAPAASAPSSLFRLTYYWIDYVVGYWWIIRRQCVAGKHTVFDRYFFDFLVDPRRSRLSLPGWVSRAYLAVTPKPDLVFILDCDPDIIFARKQELPRDEIARQLERYRELANTDEARFVRLDASRSLDQLVAEAMRELVVRSYERIRD